MIVSGVSARCRVPTIARDRPLYVQDAPWIAQSSESEFHSDGNLKPLDIVAKEGVRIVISGIQRNTVA